MICHILLKSDDPDSSHSIMKINKILSLSFLSCIIENCSQVAVMPGRCVPFCKEIQG